MDDGGGTSIVGGSVAGMTYHIMAPFKSGTIEAHRCSFRYAEDIFNRVPRYFQRCLLSSMYSRVQTESVVVTY